MWVSEIMLQEKIKALKKSNIKEIIDRRIKEFEQKRTNDEIFSELCFCLLTANFTADRSIRIQEQIGTKGFLHLSLPDLSLKLKDLGHRFYNKRAEFIFFARKNKDALFSVLNKYKDENKIRDYVVDNIKGLGYKESSHFLRNIGYKNFAIIDFHIIDLLVKEGFIEKQKTKTLTKRKYLEIEKVLFSLSQKVNLNLAELDLYLWYLETGKILK